MRCEDVLPRLSDVLDGRYRPTNGDASGDNDIELHLSSCASCQAVLQKLRAVSQVAFAQRDLFPKEANDAYFDGASHTDSFSARLMARLEQEPAPNPEAAEPFPQGDLFAADLDSFAKLDASEATGLSIPTAFVAARRESSVLFDLQRLVNAARPQQNNTPRQKEGSGLLDFRALGHHMRQQIGAFPVSRSDTTVRGPQQVTPGATLTPAGPSKPSRSWALLLLLGSAAALAAALVLFLTGNLGGKTPPAAQTVIVQAPVTPPANNALAVAPPPTPTPTDPAVAPTPTPTPVATPTVAPTVAPKVADPKKASDPKTPKEAAVKPEPTATPTATPAVTPTVTATPPANNGGKHNDELDDLLGTKKDTGSAAASGPETLSNAQIQGVMGKASFTSCKALGTGKVSMKVTINSGGNVTNAAGDGTPLGNCAAGIVRRLKFPTISSPSQTFPYPVFIKE